MPKNRMDVEVRLLTLPRPHFYKSINVCVTVVTYWLAAIDQDSNIHYRMPVGKKIVFERKPSPEFDKPLKDEAGDSIEDVKRRVNAMMQSRGHIVAISPQDFFKAEYGWEKVKAKFEEGQDPFLDME